MRYFVNNSFLVLIIVSVLFSRCKNRALEDAGTWKDTITTEYSSLLKLTDWDQDSTNRQIINLKTKISKLRNPVTSFFIKGKYYLQLYKIDDACKKSLKEIVKTSFSDAHNYIYTPYDLDDRSDMEFLYNLVRPPKPQNIYLDLYGDSTTTIEQSDTLVYYYSKCADFYIKYAPQAAMDIYGECQSKTTSELPLEIMFQKRGQKLYLWILSAKDAASAMPPRTLISLFPNK